MPSSCGIDLPGGALNLEEDRRLVDFIGVIYSSDLSVANPGVVPPLSRTLSKC